jgi:hypothetical protein
MPSKREPFANVELFVHQIWFFGCDSPFFNFVDKVSHKANSLEKKLSIEKSSVEEKVQERTTELTAQIEQLKAENQLLASQGVPIFI